MPGRQRKRGRADGPLEAAIRALASALDANATPWVLIGGIAVIARGVRRMTTDVDAVVPGGDVDIEQLLEQLARERILPRIDDALAFAEQTLVLLLRHQPTGVDVDLAIGWTELEREAIACGERIPFGTVSAAMARPADLVVFKAIAGRPKDLEDATALLLLYPALDRQDIVRRVADLAALAETPELLATFTRLIDALPRSDEAPNTRSAARDTASPSRKRPRSRR